MEEKIQNIELLFSFLVGIFAVIFDFVPCLAALDRAMSLLSIRNVRPRSVFSRTKLSQTICNRSSSVGWVVIYFLK